MMLYNLRQQENRNPAEANRVTQSARQFMLSIQARERERKAFKVDVDRYLLDFKSHRQSIKHNYAIILASRVHPALEEERLGDKASWKSKR